MNEQHSAKWKYLYLQVLDRMGEAGDGQERGVVEVLDKDLVVDRGGHQNDLELAVSFQQLAELQKQEVAIHRTFVNLSWGSAIASPVRTHKLHLIDYDVCHVVQFVSGSESTKHDTGGTEQNLGPGALFRLTTDRIAH